METGVSMAQQFTGLPMEALIGGPLNAATKANAAMAMTQTDFMLTTCFQKDDDENYSPIMIKMSLTRGVITPATYKPDGTLDQAASIQSFETKFDLPLITIIPLNSLAVESVDVSFEMQVKSSFSEETSKDKETAIKAAATFSAKAGWGPLSVSIKGSASYDHKDSEHHNTHYQKSNSAKYTVNVHAGQLPLPKGVNTIIDAFASAIQPVELPAPPQQQNNNNNNNTGG